MELSKVILTSKLRRSYLGGFGLFTWDFHGVCFQHNKRRMKRESRNGEYTIWFLDPVDDRVLKVAKVSRRLFTDLLKASNNYRKKFLHESKNPN